MEQVAQERTGRWPGHADGVTCCGDWRERPGRAPNSRFSSDRAPCSGMLSIFAASVPAGFLPRQPEGFVAAQSRPVPGAPSRAPRPPAHGAGLLRLEKGTPPAFILVPAYPLSPLLKIKIDL